MASTSTGTNTTDLATTRSLVLRGQTLFRNQDSDSQEGARKVKSLMSVLRCPKPSWISRIIENNRY